MPSALFFWGVLFLDVAVGFAFQSLAGVLLVWESF